MVESENYDFSYCVLTPERIVDGDDYAEGHAFGIGPENDMTEAYDKIFGIKNHMYSVLSMCIYEVRFHC